MSAKSVVLLVLVAYYQDGIEAQTLVGNPLAAAYLCNNSKQVIAQFEVDRAPEDEHSFFVFIDVSKYGGLGISNNVAIKLDAPGNITLLNKGFARIRSQPGGIFTIRTYKAWPTQRLGITVNGMQRMALPNILSVQINNVEICEHPVLGQFDRFIRGDDETSAVANPTSINGDLPSCGRRIVDHTELITNGQDTRPGDWPWHVALYGLENKGATQKYRCGGTLVSKTAVVTAAHCVTVRGVPIIPEKLKIVLGKYNLIGGDVESEEREIFQVISHPEFNYTSFRNDIAVLKLSTEAAYSPYVQPACLWEDQNNGKIQVFNQIGTLAGWGFNEHDTLSNTLMRAELPIISDVTCLLSFASFYGKFLSDASFCAGYRNGTSACNGDSGGGLLLPRKVESFGKPSQDIWYLRGIVSLSVSKKNRQICDPQYYVIFTDAAQYVKWIRNNI